MLSQISVKLNWNKKEDNIWIKNKYLAIPSKVSLNFLMIYPPINIPVARVGMVIQPRNKRKISLYTYNYSEMSFNMKHTVYQPNSSNLINY